MIKLIMAENRPTYNCECALSTCDVCRLGSTQGGGDIKMADLYDVIKNPPSSPINETTHVYYVETRKDNDQTRNNS